MYCKASGRRVVREVDLKGYCMKAGYLGTPCTDERDHGRHVLRHDL